MKKFITKNWFRLLLSLFLIIIISSSYQYLQEYYRVNKTQQITDTDISSYKIIDLHTPVEADGFIIISNEYCWYAEEILVHYEIKSGHLEKVICNFPPADVCSEYKTRLDSVKARNYESLSWEWSNKLLHSNVIIGQKKSDIGKNNAPVYYCTIDAIPSRYFLERN